jgi:hypothetical protein
VNVKYVMEEAFVNTTCGRVDVRNVEVLLFVIMDVEKIAAKFVIHVNI